MGPETSVVPVCPVAAVESPGTPRRSPARRARVRPVEVLAVLLLVAVLSRGWLLGASGSPRAQAWLTVFVSIVVQAAPFVVLGTLVSASIAVLVPAGFFARVLPARGALAVPVAGAAGMLLPGRERGPVPVAGALMRRGVTPGAALAFLLAAPAINPVVLVATSVAFPGQPEMVLGRLVASLAAAVVMGWVWLRVGRGPGPGCLSARSWPGSGKARRCWPPAGRI
jgi:uncharacterized membrane protein YraQ (UPF0718 family)